jgi:hypothetical protein
VARLQHPGIVQIFEVGEHEGTPFFSLEFVAGGSLAARLAQGPLPPKQAAALAEAVARAMQAAHDRGIVHRDLKPQNVLLTEDSQPKVTDFGLAKQLEGPAGQTRTGEVMGTPSYMAPEQAMGSREVGPAADVYALGAVLYELLTGRPPFRAATTMDTLLQVLEAEAVPARQLNPSVPRDVDTLCWKCLRKKPHERYASAADLAEDLRRFLDGQPIQARPPGLWRRLDQRVRRLPDVVGQGAVVGGFLVIGVLVAGGPAGLLTAVAVLTAMTALVRANPRALLGGALAGSVPTAVLLAGAILTPESLGTDKWARVIGLTFVPVLCGLIAGVVVRERWRSLLYLPGLAWHCWSFLPGAPEFFAPLAAIAWVGIAYAALGRMTAWYFGGSAVKAILGALGTSVVGVAAAGLVVKERTKIPWANNPLFIPVPGIILLGSAAIGAMLGARVKRKRRS